MIIMLLTIIVLVCIIVLIAYKWDSAFIKNTVSQVKWSLCANEITTLIENRIPCTKEQLDSYGAENIKDLLYDIKEDTVELLKNWRSLCRKYKLLLRWF